MRAIYGHARPRNIHRSGIGYSNDADNAGLPQSFPAFSDRLVVRRKRGRSFRGGPREIHDDFALQVEAGEIVVVHLWDLQAVADEHKWRGNFLGCEINARVEVGIFAEHERLDFAVETSAADESFSTISRETNFTGW